MQDYEIRLLKRQGRLDTAILVSSDTDAHAMLALKKLRSMQYVTVEVWKGLECIYVGDKPLHAR